MQEGFALRRSQASLVELLIIALGASACLTLLLSINPTSTEPIKSQNMETEETLINYLKYKGAFNETNSFLITSQCNNETFFMQNEPFFNETKRVIESLNNNNSFILFINISTKAWSIYNNQESVCLREAKLARTKLETPCGQGEMIYGSWKGEAPLIC